MQTQNTDKFENLPFEVLFKLVWLILMLPARP